MSLKNKTKKLLRKYDKRPTKALGQHFLVDREIINSMVEKGEIDKNDNILEVGPGLGFLTDPLVQKAKKVFAVETDSQLVKILKNQLGDHSNLEIIEADILQVDIDNFSSLKEDRYKIIASLPYQITNNMFRKLTEDWPKPSLAVLLVQKEVGQRVVAPPSDTNRGILSVAVQSFFKVDFSKSVSPESFLPSPRVNSALIRLELKPESSISLLGPDEREKFFKVVRAGFNQRRKKVLNPISNLLNVDKRSLKEEFDKAGVAESSRAQDLSIEDWLVISKNI